MYYVLVRSSKTILSYLYPHLLLCFNPPNNDERPFMPAEPFKKGYYQAKFYGCRRIYLEHGIEKMAEICAKCKDSWMILKKVEEKEVKRVLENLEKIYGKGNVRLVSDTSIHILFQHSVL